MQQLTNSEIDTLCLKYLSNAQGNGLIHDYLNFLYLTGCRPSEPLNPLCFIAYTIENLVIKPAKGNNLRYIDKTLVPSTIFAPSNSNKSILLPKDYENTLLKFKRWTPYQWTLNEAKNSQLYLFRYNYVKKLYDDGFKNDEIQIIMGWTNTNMAQRYISKPIFKVN